MSASGWAPRASAPASPSRMAAWRAPPAITGVFARLESAIDYEAVDGQPVDLVFMLLAPENAGADHLKALARVSRLLRNQQTCEKLRAAQSAEALYAILIDQTGESSLQAACRRGSLRPARSSHVLTCCSHAPGDAPARAKLPRCNCATLYFFFFDAAFAGAFGFTNDRHFLDQDRGRPAPGPAWARGRRPALLKSHPPRPCRRSPGRRR